MNGKKIMKSTTFVPPVDVTPKKAERLAQEYAYAFESVQRLRQFNENMRFSELADWYFTNYAPIELKESTVYTYKGQYKNHKDKILLVCDGVSWHKSKTLEVPENINLIFIPPYTPEMNPIEQIWKEIRKLGFKNEVFKTLEKVIDRLCDTIRSLSSDTIKSITGRDWIMSIS